MVALKEFIFVRRIVKENLTSTIRKNSYMTDLNYLDTITKQSQEKFKRMKEKMLEPIKQVQQARQESLRK